MNPLVGECSPLLKLLILWFHMWCHHGWSHHWMYLTRDSGSLSSSSSSSWHVQVISVSEIISIKNTTVILELQWCFLLELVCSPLWKRWDWCTCVNECFDLTVFVLFFFFSYFFKCTICFCQLSSSVLSTLTFLESGGFVVLFPLVCCCWRNVVGGKELIVGRHGDKVIHGNSKQYPQIAFQMQHPFIFWEHQPGCFRSSHLHYLFVFTGIDLVQVK